MSSYAERYVAFLDILGFRDLISRSVSQDAQVSVDQIRSVLEVPDPAGEEQIVLYSSIGDISKSGHRLTAFSDSIVITTDPTEQGLLHLIHHVETIGFRLVKLRVLYRGGIARGLAHHDEKHVFGPAVIDAYELEKRAEVPRVILSEPVIEAGRSAAEPVRTVFDLFTRVDNDGAVFVNYLRLLRIIVDLGSDIPPDLRSLFFPDLGPFIAGEIARYDSDPKKRRKIEWFRDYLRWATDDSRREIVRTR